MRDSTASPVPTGDRQPWDVEDIDRLLARPARVAVGRVGEPPAGRPLIGFTAGVPDGETFPVEEIGRAVDHVLATEPVQALEYLPGSLHGLVELRRLVVERLEPEAGLALSEANVTITSGAAQALENIGRTFLDPGDTFLVEAPSYRGGIGAFRGAGGVPVPIEMDGHGIRLDQLRTTIERLAVEGRPPKLLYTMPTFHNPTGITMPLERRRQLVEFAARRRLLLVEDDAYGDLRFRGDTLPSLYSIAGGLGVLRCGTVSKTIAPGLRVAWVKGQPALVDALVRMRFDNGTSAFLQRIVCAYVNQGAFEPHVRAMVELYRHKHQAMDAALGEHCSSYASWTEPDGGFYVWVTLPPGVDCVALQEQAWDEGVGYFLGTAFYTDGSGRDRLRLAFSNVPIEQIPEGCARLGRALARAVAGRA
jgi:2-aminoadipate transaminase